MAVAENSCAGKQVRQEVADDLAHEDKIRLPLALARQSHEARQHARHLHDGEVLQHVASLRHLQLHDHVQRFIEQLRKRMRRIDGQRREHGTHLREVIFFEPCEVGSLKFFDGEKANTFLRQLRQKLLAPAFVLFLHQPVNALLDRLKPLGRSQPIHAPAHHIAFNLLLDAGHAHFEKLVEVRTENRKELHALQQWHLRITSFGEDAAIEFKPTQLAVQKRCVGRTHNGIVREPRDEEKGPTVTKRLKSTPGPLRGGKMPASRTIRTQPLQS